MLNKEYWNERWIKSDTGWDIGYASPPLMNYLDSLDNQSLQILIPGSGNGYEAGHAFRNGFHHTYYNDISIEAASKFRKKFPDFPENQVLATDFFELTGKFDLILEQTSFCAQPPSKRMDYVNKAHELLEPDGFFTGVLFNVHFPFDGPPFGGDIEDYKNIFSPMFKLIKMDICYNSINPRQGKELFVILQPQ